MIRDLALHASGLLSPTLGGPSSYPPAPKFLFQPPTSYGPKVWLQDDGPTQYRRSLYVHQYRSVPYPPLQMFDAPKGDAACVRRERSNTPLQALVLLNEPQFLDAARGLGRRVLQEVSAEEFGDAADRQRITVAYRLCTSRNPDVDEIEVLLKLLNSQRAANAKTEKAELQALLGQTQAARTSDDQVSAAEQAAWITVARAILNLDETITKS
jgi:hypothetical protein